MPEILSLILKAQSCVLPDIPAEMYTLLHPPSSASFPAEISVRSPQKISIFIKREYGSKYPKNILVNSEYRINASILQIMLDRVSLILFFDDIRVSQYVLQH